MAHWQAPALTKLNAGPSVAGGVKDGAVGGSVMDSLNDETVASGVGMYLVLCALLVLGGIGFYMGYRVFGGILVCGIVALLAALVSGAFP